MHVVYVQGRVEDFGGLQPGIYRRRHRERLYLCPAREGEQGPHRSFGSRIKKVVHKVEQGAARQHVLCLHCEQIV